MSLSFLALASVEMAAAMCLFPPLFLFNVCFMPSHADDNTSLVSLIVLCHIECIAAAETETYYGKLAQLATNAKFSLLPSPSTST